MAKKAIRPIRIEGNIAYVPLTQGYEAIIDAADVPLVEGRNWFAIVNPHTVYAGCMVQKPRRAVLRMHRVLMNCTPSFEVDHKDGDGRNNRRGNLRLATSAQNKFNRKARTNNKSGFPGVHVSAQTKKWRAQICVNGKTIHLGYFDKPEDARDCYMAAKAQLHGAFANTTR